MTNGDWVRSLNDEELALYIYSVYCAGKTNDETQMINYFEWLKQPHYKKENKY